MLCRLVGMSRQNYYHQRRVRERAEVEEGLVLALVRQERSRQPRLGGRKLWWLIQGELAAAEVALGRDRFFGVLRRHNLLIVRRRRGCRTTQSGHGFRVYANLAQEVVLWRPHQLLVSDITYLRTLEGFLYLALVMDAYSRKIVGHDCSDSLEAEGARRALRMALRQLPAGAGAMHHSDRGVQYCCGEYIQMLEAAGMAISMTEENHCYENAKAERLNGILKQEYGLGETQATKAGARRLVDQAVGLYNAYRPHTALGYACPSQVHAATVHGAGAACDRSRPGGVMPVAGSLVFLNGGRECNGPAAPRPGARQLEIGT